MKKIKLSKSEHAEVLAAAARLATHNSFSCITLGSYAQQFDVVMMYSEFYGKPYMGLWSVDEVPPTQDERVLMLLTFAEVCK